MAYLPHLMVYGVRLHLNGRKPGRKTPLDAEHSHSVPSERNMARGHLVVCAVGRTAYSILFWGILSGT